jgi:purine nucleoside phosphorylase
MSLRERALAHYRTVPSLSPFTQFSKMSDHNEFQSDEEIHQYLTNGGPSHFDMDEAFCARMRKAIEAGLERAPIGVVTTPGTKNPKYVPTEPPPLVSSQHDLEHAF